MGNQGTRIFIGLRQRERRVVCSFTMAEAGSLSLQPFLELKQAIEELVLLSGGKINIYDCDQIMGFEISWPVASTQPLQIAQKEKQISQDQQWLDRVFHLVEKRYADADFGTTIAAKLLFMSERSLQRRFKLHFQQTFTEYLNDVRLVKAGQMLVKGQKVSEVAFCCGFNDPSYFSQRFKSKFGASPTQFVEEREEKVEGSTVL
jgi:AraC family chitin signaling transcriptional activator